jgi:hypothetical protein
MLEKSKPDHETERNGVPLCRNWQRCDAKFGQKRRSIHAFNVLFVLYASMIFACDGAIVTWHRMPKANS